MRIKFFRYVGPKKDWELNFIGKVWNFRIGSAQIALWRANIQLWWLQDRIETFATADGQGLGR